MRHALAHCVVSRKGVLRMSSSLCEVVSAISQVIGLAIREFVFLMVSGLHNWWWHGTFCRPLACVHELHSAVHYLQPGHEPFAQIDTLSLNTLHSLDELIIWLDHLLSRVSFWGRLKVKIMHIHTDIMWLLTLLEPFFSVWQNSLVLV